MKRVDESPTERLLASVTTKPPRSTQQAEFAARSLSSGRCALRPVVAARAALARAEDAGATVADVVKARREIERLEATFGVVCILPRPRGG